ncbi:MAG TPA: hypothetical protein VGK32_04005 [Vicinamibacterales bacterium]|jgi:hypothetical protein
MMSRLIAVVGWLAVGHAALFGVFWTLLQVPESNVLMLAASALLTVALVVLAAWIEGVGLNAWRAEGGLLHSARDGWRTIPAVLVGLLLFCVIWWLCGWMGAWWTAHRGETDAWLMLHFGWTRTTAVHRGIDWFLIFIRYALGTSLALGLGWQIIVNGFHSIVSTGWLRAAFSPRQLALIVFSMTVFVWLPWQAAYWRPAWLAPDWQEPGFAAVKLGMIYLVANLGWALVLGAVATRGRFTRTTA